MSKLERSQTGLGSGSAIVACHFVNVALNAICGRVHNHAGIGLSGA